MDIIAKASIDANISEGIYPSCVGLTSSVLPEVQTPIEENSQTGVSTSNAPIKTIKLKPHPGTIPHWYAIRCTYERECKAYELFSKKGIEAFYPTITSTKTIGGKTEKVVESRLYIPKNQGLACLIFALVAIVVGDALCLWIGKLSILYVALSVILLFWGVICWIKWNG